MTECKYELLQKIAMDKAAEQLAIACSYHKNSEGKLLMRQITMAEAIGVIKSAVEYDRARCPP